MGGNAAYKGSHEAPDALSGAPLHNLKNIYPDDIYGTNGARYYGDGSPDDAMAVSVMRNMRNKPDAQVTVYRAVPEILGTESQISKLDAEKAYILKTGKIPKTADSHGMNKSEYYNYISEEIDKLKAGPVKPDEPMDINPGDWVTTIRNYAKGHGEHALNGKYKIISKRVPAKNLYTDGNSVFEFGYDPSENDIRGSSVPKLLSLTGAGASGALLAGGAVERAYRRNKEREKKEGKK